jgi:DNA-binding LacI/PurR family transcriptional regulator
VARQLARIDPIQIHWASKNGVTFVSNGATDRAERPLEKLGPLPLARTKMPSAKRRLVGLLLSPHTGPHLSESVAWLQEAAWALDYDVLTYSIRNRKQQAMPLSTEAEGF